jgi:hypothetical protein
MAELTLKVLPQHFAVCRLHPDAEIPGWVFKSPFFSITGTEDELSVVCAEEQLPSAGSRPDGQGGSPGREREHRRRNEAEPLLAEKDWRALQVEGPLDFALTGVLASLTAPLAEAGISVFAISAYTTDYLLIKQEAMERALKILGRFCKVYTD